jgi:UDP-N-acetyl-D-galactosamine dehydrogenase
MKIIAILGLGYVGLPLAIEFGKYRRTIGFDINENRIAMLVRGNDLNLEIDTENIKAARFLTFSSCPDDLRQAQIFIVAVPTPVDQKQRPDLTLLINVSKMVGKVLKKNDIVIYESTVYPGVTEEICAQALEETSGLQFNVHFFCGYSPERINPGDKVNTLTTIRKITSGSTPTTAREVDQLYREIIKAGTYMAPSIKVAEAAKVTENSQRDINIAFVNELARIFNLIGIDTREVLQAAKTKWNFLPFEPGLVGGHCIAVDPYYLTYMAQELNYNPELILAGRRVNDTMSHYVVVQVVKTMIKKGISLSGSNVLVLGITFKEHCHDIRNSKAIDIICELKEFDCHVDVIDPWASPKEVYEELGFMLKPVSELPTVNGKTLIDHYDAVVITVAHQEFLTYDFSAMMNCNKVIYDVKGILPKGNVDARL